MFFKKTFTPPPSPPPITGDLSLMPHGSTLAEYLIQNNTTANDFSLNCKARLGLNAKLMVNPLMVRPN